jgi:uncharacterized membrane protein
VPPETFRLIVVLVSVVIASLNFVIFAGAICMLTLRAFPLAMAACVLAMIPGVTAACCTGAPFGYWAYVVLSKPKIREAFYARRKSRRRRTFP